MLIYVRSVIRKSDRAPSCAVCAEIRSRQIAAELCWRITHAAEPSSHSLKRRRESNSGSDTEKAGTLVRRPLQTGAFYDKDRNVVCFAVSAFRHHAEKRAIRAQHVPDNRVYILQGSFLCVTDFLKRNLFSRTQKSIDVSDPFSLIALYKHG